MSLISGPSCGLSKPMLQRRLSRGKPFFSLMKFKGRVPYWPSSAIFYEKMPELHVIAAGSLLDFSLGAPRVQGFSFGWNRTASSVSEWVLSRAFLIPRGTSRKAPATGARLLFAKPHPYGPKRGDVWKHIAIVAVARHMLELMYTLLSKHELYRFIPSRNPASTQVSRGHHRWKLYLSR